MLNEENDSVLDRQRNHLLDFIKGCGCIGVIFIHFSFPGIVGTIIVKVSEYAIPVFLMISGYFAYSVKGDTSEKIRRRSKRIIKIMLYAMALYFIYTLFIKFKDHCVSTWLAGFVSWKQWIKIIIFSDFDIIGCGHLWFLSAQIISYFILLYIDKNNLYRYAYKSIPCLFILRIVVTVITRSNNLTWHLSGNFLFDSIPWMLLGNYFAYNKEFSRKFSNKTIIISFVAGVIFAIIAVVLFVFANISIDLSEVGIVVFASSLFLLAINNPTLSISGRVERLGYIYSLYVYIFHPVVGGVFEHMVGFMRIKESVIFFWIRPIIVAGCSIIGSIIWHTIVSWIKLKRKQF